MPLLPRRGQRTVAQRGEGFLTQTILLPDKFAVDDSLNCYQSPIRELPKVAWG